MEEVRIQMHFYPSLPSEIDIESGSSESVGLLKTISFRSIFRTKFFRLFFNHILLPVAKVPAEGTNSVNEDSLT